MNTINTEQLRKEINKTNASLFRVSFVKANGENRTMFCKTKIKRHLSRSQTRKWLRMLTKILYVYLIAKVNRTKVLSCQVLLSLLVTIRF